MLIHAHIWPLHSYVFHLQRNSFVIYIYMIFTHSSIHLSLIVLFCCLFLTFPNQKKKDPKVCVSVSLCVPPNRVPFFKAWRKKSQVTPPVEAGHHAVVTFWSGKLARVLGNLGRAVPPKRGEWWVFWWKKTHTPGKWWLVNNVEWRLNWLIDYSKDFWPGKLLSSKSIKRI